MKSTFSFIVLAAIMLLTSSQANSQLTMQEQSAKSMFVEISNLQLDNFTTLFRALENSPFETAGNCIPAHIVAFRLKTGVNPDEQTIAKLKIFLENNGFPNYKVLSGFTYEDFQNRWIEARSSGQ